MSDDFCFGRRGIIFIVSAPSGAGKTTLARLAVGRLEGLALSVSCTTRKPRAGEVEGIDYRFLSEEEFRQQVDRSAFAEWANVHGYLYGTEKAPLERAIADRRDILLDIDVQGAKQIVRLYPEAVSVFVLPPTLSELEKRLRARGTEEEETIQRRLKRAKEETKELRNYDYYIINKEIEEAAGTLVSIIEAERHRVRRVG